MGNKALKKVMNYRKITNLEKAMDLKNTINLSVE